MNPRNTNMIRIALLLALVGGVGFLWSRPDSTPEPVQDQVAAPAVVTAPEPVEITAPVQRQEAASSETKVEPISRDRWADDAKALQRELIEAVLRGDEAAVERAQAKARALAARSAATAGR